MIIVIQCSPSWLYSVLLMIKTHRARCLFPVIHEHDRTYFLITIISPQMRVQLVHSMEKYVLVLSLLYTH